jgi:phosphohistidine phosphatase
MSDMAAMRRLLLLRHAKAARGRGGDIERPLKRAGRQASSRLAAYLAEAQLRPDLALVSPSRRTQETWRLVQPALGDVPMRAEPRLYMAPANRLLTIIRDAGDASDTLLVVGHNPGLEELARVLVRDSDRHAAPEALASFPTAALAVIDFEAESWRDIAPGSGRLERFVTPRSLGVAEDD